MDRPMISKIENNSREVLDYEVKALAKALKVSINDLFK
ncbi:helix-turn-helix domain-containing protein [Clostridium argentinense]|nr:helix-turn-helix domain-containing protein [Clostridium argentinense]